MRGKFITLHTNSARSVRELTATPELEELQKAVGGYLEQIPYFLTFEGERCVAFCNEEGKMHWQKVGGYCRQSQKPCSNAPE